MLQDQTILRTMMAHYPLDDRYESTPGAGNTIDARGGKSILFTLLEGAGGTGTVTVTIQKCNSAGASGGNISFKARANTQTAQGTLGSAVATYATTAGANKTVEFFVDCAALGEYGYCTLTLTELVDADCDAAVLAQVFK